MPLHKLSNGIAILPCKVTDAENLSYAEQAAEAMSLGDTEEIRFESAKSGFKARIGEYRAKSSRLMHIIGTGTEDRDVAIETFSDFENGCIITFRADTGEEIKRRPMTGAEFQARLSLKEFSEADHITNRFVDIMGDDAE